MLKCDICKEAMQRAEQNSLERLIQEHIDGDIQDICAECGTEILDGIFEFIEVLKNNRAKAPPPAPRKIRRRRQYTKAEGEWFTKRVQELIQKYNSNTKILDILDTEFPARLRKSNSIRIREIRERNQNQRRK